MLIMKKIHQKLYREKMKQISDALKEKQEMGITTNTDTEETKRKRKTKSEYKRQKRDENIQQSSRPDWRLKPSKG